MHAKIPFRFKENDLVRVRLARGQWEAAIVVKVGYTQELSKSKSDSATAADKKLWKRLCSPYVVQVHSKCKSYAIPRDFFHPRLA